MFAIQRRFQCTISIFLVSLLVLNDNLAFAFVTIHGRRCCRRSCGCVVSCCKRALSPTSDRRRRIRAVVFQSQSACSNGVSSSRRPSLLFMKHDSKPTDDDEIITNPTTTTTTSVTWKLRPPLDASLFDQLCHVASNQYVLWSCRLRRQKPPLVVFPNNNQAVLLAFVNGRPIGKFGFMTSPGPSVPELEDTVRKIYHNNKSNQNHDPLRAAAILYMFVEPEFRGRNIGQQALRIIAYLHHVAGCNYTILIADDKQRDTTTTRTGRLVRWYERSGYTIAPDLEDMMGTARGTLGVPMIAPVHESSELPEGVFLEWW